MISIPKAIYSIARSFHAISAGALLLTVACNAEQDSHTESTRSAIDELSDCEFANSEAQSPSDIVAIQQVASTASQLQDTLSPAQASTTVYCVGDVEQHSWTNVPGRRPGGIALSSLTEPQHKLVWNLMDGFLSDSGYRKIHFLATDIEEASGAGTLGDYTIAIFGRPSIDAVWGFQFDGHHIALNFLVDADDVVLSPSFVGSQPLELNGREALPDEQTRGRVLFKALNVSQVSKAKLPDLVQRRLFSGSGSGHVDRGKDFDFTSFNQVGLPIEDMNESQVDLVVDLVKTYLLNLDEQFAPRTIEKVVSRLTDGYFVYSVRGSRVYYRIFVEDTILIEYGDVAANHIHTVTRLLGKKPMRDYGGYANISESSSVLAHLMTSEHHQTRH